MRVVNVEVSGGVPAPVNTVWTLLTAFSDTIDYRFTRNDVEKILHGQARRSSDGRRKVMFSSFNRLVGCLYEELIRADAKKYVLQYKLTSDPRNFNPFPASFLDVLTTIKLYSSTLDNSTFVRVYSTFKTEIEMSGVMSSTWERIHRQMLMSLIGSISDPRKVHDASFPTTGAPRLFNASACNGSEGGTASDAQLPSIKPNPRAVPSLEAATIAAPRQPTYQYFLADQRPGNAMAGANGELMPKARSSPSCHTRIKPEYPQVGEGPDVQPEPMASTASETQRRFFRSSTGNFESTASSLSPAQTLVVERRASLEVLSPRCAAVGVNAWLPSSSSGLETALPEAPGAPSGLSSPTFRMDQCWAGRAFDLITSQK